MIAYKVLSHVHHAKAIAFFAANPKIATCPITELNLLRVLMSLGHTGKQADAALDDLISRHRGKFIPCDISATEIFGLSNGHKQTTDSYLAALAKSHKITIATLDEDFRKRFPSMVELVD